MRRRSYSRRRGRGRKSPRISLRVRRGRVGRRM